MISASPSTASGTMVFTRVRKPRSSNVPLTGYLPRAVNEMVSAPSAFESVVSAAAIAAFTKP